MKLSQIQKVHIHEAAKLIDINGIPTDKISNNYWVKLANGKEYPFKHLVSVAYQQIPGCENKKLEFVSNETYRNFVENNLGFTINNYKEGYNFITTDDLSHYAKIGRKSYRKKNLQDVTNAQLLKPLVCKLNIWAEHSIVGDLVNKKDNHWQWSGTFKDYLWIKIFRKNSSRNVFFVVGVSHNGHLFYKLDCLRSNYSKTGVLPKEKQKVFDDYLNATDCKEQSISKDQIKNYNWDKLCEVTTKFFNEYISLYNELDSLVENEFPTPIKEDSLNFTDVPLDIKSYQGKAKKHLGQTVDWQSKNETSSILGYTGEQLVIKYERNKLLNNQMKDKADLVHKVKDGRGFDILSYNLDGEEMHIEVKTTMQKKNEPFYMSTNEREYLENYPEKYFLYRLYNFRYNQNKADVYVLTPNMLKDSATFTPINFEVSLSKD